MSLEQMARPEIMEAVGILTWSLCLLAFLLGIFRGKMARVLKTAYLKTHVALAAAALLLGTLHAVVTLIYY